MSVSFKVIFRDGSTHEVELDSKPTLAQLQHFVGGYIEQIPTKNSEQCLIVNEDGISLNLLSNYNASILAGQPIFGDVVLIDKDFLA